MAVWTYFANAIAGIFEKIAAGINSLLNMKNARIALVFLGLFFLGGAMWIWFGLAASLAFSGLSCVGMSIYFERTSRKEEPNE